MIILVISIWLVIGLAVAFKTLEKFAPEIHDKLIAFSIVFICIPFWPVVFVMLIILRDKRGK